MKIKYSTNFIRRYKKLPNNIKLLAQTKEQIFINNPFDIRLKSHKLSGKFFNFWAFSVDYKYRIIFEFISEDLVGFYYIGTHDIYK